MGYDGPGGRQQQQPAASSAGVGIAAIIHGPRPPPFTIASRLRVTDFNVHVGFKFAHLFDVRFNTPPPPLLLTLLLRKVKNL